MEVKVGDRIVFVDTHRNHRPALVTHVWGQETYPSGGAGPTINLVTISDDPKRDDTYGRQRENQTSVTHWKNQQVAGGYCWYHADERVESQPDGSLKEAA
jgi:hypothetical protein